MYLLLNLQQETNKTEINGDFMGEKKAVNLIFTLMNVDHISIQWPTRVFAMECIRMILHECKKHSEHMDLQLARKMKEENTSKEFLVTQLAELVRLAFIAGTSVNDLLKLEGMLALQDVVLLFAKVPGNGRDLIGDKSLH